MCPRQPGDPQEVADNIRRYCKCVAHRFEAEREFSGRNGSAGTQGLGVVVPKR